MKIIKSISLYFIYPSLMLILGFWGGAKTARFFYPGDTVRQPVRQQDESFGVQAPAGQPAGYDEPDVREVSGRGETLSVETKYVLEETDILKGSEVETVWKLPDQYVGMNREQFLTAMAVYEKAPPLSELERGFVSLEVLSFSREKVVVQMNYRYLPPQDSYYLAVMDNEVVVLADDRATVYINTGIRLDSLPWELQKEIIQMQYIEDDESLYSFLENYSS